MLVEKSATKLDGLAWCGDLKPGPSKAGCCFFLDHFALAFIYLLVPLGWHTIAIVPVLPTMISARSDACKRLMHEMSGNGHKFDRGIQTVGSDIVQSTKRNSLLSQAPPPDSLPSVTQRHGSQTNKFPRIKIWENGSAPLTQRAVRSTFGTTFCAMHMGPILVSETARALTVTVGTATSKSSGCRGGYRPKTPGLCRLSENVGRVLIHFH